MKQICKFNTKPATIVDGGYKKGRWIVWLNLSVSEIETSEMDQNEHFQSVTDRLVLADRSLSAFLNVVDPAILAEATIEELESVLHFFQSENDVAAWKSIRRLQIQGYDESNDVNSFIIHGVKMWLDKATRVGLRLRFESEKEIGKANTTLWYGDAMFQLPLDSAISMLHYIEAYASDCYDNTQKHYKAIEELSEVSQVRVYNYKSGYPDQLQFG